MIKHKGYQPDPYGGRRPQPDLPPNHTGTGRRVDRLNCGMLEGSYDDAYDDYGYEYPLGRAGRRHSQNSNDRLPSGLTTY